MVRLLRLKLHLTQKEFGTFFGLSRQEVRTLERDRSRLTPSVISQLEEMKAKATEIRAQQDAKRGFKIEYWGGNFWIYSSGLAEDDILRAFMLAAFYRPKMPELLRVDENERMTPLVMRLARRKSCRIVCTDRKRTVSISIGDEEVYRDEQDFYPIGSWKPYEKKAIVYKAKQMLNRRYPLKRTVKGSIRARLTAKAIVKFELFEFTKNGLELTETETFEVRARLYAPVRRIQDAER